MVSPALKNPTKMAVGVKRAGDTVAEEAPVFLVVFAVPAIVALFLRWRLR